MKVTVPSTTNAVGVLVRQSSSVAGADVVDRLAERLGGQRRHLDVRRAVGSGVAHPPLAGEERERGGEPRGRRIPEELLGRGDDGIPLELLAVRGPVVHPHAARHVERDCQVHGLEPGLGRLRGARLAGAGRRASATAGVA